MRRWSPNSLISLDPEIERTLRRVRREKRGIPREQFREGTIEEEEHIEEECIERREFRRNLNFADNMEAERVNPENVGHERVEDNAEINQPRPARTIKDVNREESDATMDRLQNSFPDFNIDFEIRGPLLANLPKFYGLAGENPYMHLNYLMMHCRTMKPRNISIEDCVWKIFHLSLEGKAREWFQNLPRFSDDAYASWKNLRRAFLDQFFPATKSSAAKKEIAAARQDATESFFDFWSRFQDMLAACPNHQFSTKTLVEYFVNGLCTQDSTMLDAAANGCIYEMEEERAWNLIRTIALNRQHKSQRDIQHVKAMGSSSSGSDPILEKLARDLDKLNAKVSTDFEKLSTKVESLSTSKSIAPPSLAMVAPSCSICSSAIHITQDCPHVEEVSAMFQNGQFQKRDPFSKTYNPGWQDHPNFKWGGNQPAGSSNQGNFHNKNTTLIPIEQGPSSRPDETQQLILKAITDQSSKMDLMMKGIVATDSKVNNISSEVELLKSKYDNLSDFVTKLSNSMSEKQAQSSGGMPSSTVINPKALNAITLRSGKQIETGSTSNGKKKDKIEVAEDRVAENAEKPPTEMPSFSSTPPPTKESKGKEVAIDGPPRGKTIDISSLPFPNSYLKSCIESNIDKSLEKDKKDIFEMFKKIEISVPLLELVKKVPSYAKFLKDLCTNKRRFRANETIKLNASVSALFESTLPVKCKDPGSFTIPCTVGKIRIQGALLDLGAAINVMPTSVCKSLGLESSIKPTSMVIQLADRTLRRPIGIIEDLLVQVKNLFIPADFYIMDMSEGVVGDSTIILGRPFLRTSNVLINMKDGRISMEVGDRKVEFNVYEAMKYPSTDLTPPPLYSISVDMPHDNLDPLGLKFFPMQASLHSVPPLKRDESLSHPPSKPLFSAGDAGMVSLNRPSVDCTDCHPSPSVLPNTCSDSTFSSAIADGPFRDNVVVAHAGKAVGESLKGNHVAAPEPSKTPATQDESLMGTISKLLSQLLVSLISCGSANSNFCAAGVKAKKQKKKNKKKIKNKDANGGQAVMSAANHGCEQKCTPVSPQSSLDASNEPFEPP